MPSPTQRGKGGSTAKAPPMPPEPNLEAIRPVTPLRERTVLRILRCSRGAPPVTITPEEIRDAAEHRDLAGSLLATAALHKMRIAQARSANPWGELDLRAYLALRTATAEVNEVKAALARGRHLPFEDRRYAFDKWYKAEPAKVVARSFGALFEAVLAIDQEFSAKFRTEDGKLRYAAVDELITAAEQAGHTVHQALPPAGTYEGDDKRRSAVRDGSALICYLVTRAFPPAELAASEVALMPAVESTPTPAQAAA